MKNRIFLISLLVFLLIVQAVLRQTEDAYLTGSTDASFISFTGLTFSLPFAMFTAGACVAALGTGARIFAALCGITGKVNHKGGVFTRLASCGTWVGWPAMAACLASIYAAFPATQEGTESLMQSPLFLLLAIALPGMLACHVLDSRHRRNLSTVSLAVALAIVAACGWFWLGNPLALLIIALVLAYGTAKLLAHKFSSRIKGGAMVCAALAYAFHCFSGSAMFQSDLYRVGADCMLFYAAALLLLAGMMWLKWYSMAPGKPAAQD